MNAQNKCCSGLKGSLKNIYIVRAEDIAKVNYDSRANGYWGIELSEGAAFTEYSFAEGQATFVEKMVRRGGVSAVEQRIEFATSAAIVDYLASLNEKCRHGAGLVAIVVDYNQIVRLVGYSQVMGAEQALAVENYEFSTHDDVALTPNQKVVLRAVSPSRAARVLDDVLVSSR